jgi:hypothetical protein
MVLTFAMLAFEPLPDRQQPLFLRPVMAVVGSRHGLLDFLVGEEVVIDPSGIEWFLPASSAKMSM